VPTRQALWLGYSDGMLPGPRGAERVHPNVILAVLSLAGAVYAVLSSAVIPALPTLQHDPNASETGVTWLLTGFLLSASFCRPGQPERCAGNETTCWNVGLFCQGMFGWPTIPSDRKPMAS
jgi:hypothetical protein